MNEGCVFTTEMTPKTDENGVAFSLRNRDFKDPQCIATYRKTGHPQTAEQGQGWEETDVNDTLNIYDTGEVRTPTLVTQVFENHSQDSRYRPLGETCQTVSATYGMGGNNQPLVAQVYDASRRHDYQPFGDICETVQAQYGTGGNNVPMVREISEIGGDQEVEKQPKGAVVRRLTPLECNRLQGFPEREENGKIISWVDIGEWKDSKGKIHKDADSPKYKALGNSIGLPWWSWLAKRIVRQLRKDGVEKPTMGSLFSGIGGFELVFKRAGCEPIWASEIEPFAIAVTEKHFGNEEKGIVGDIEKYL